MGTLDRSKDFGIIVPAGAIAVQGDKRFRLSDDREVDDNGDVIEDEVVHIAPEESMIVEELDYSSATKADIMKALDAQGIPYSPQETKPGLWNRLKADNLA